MTERTITARAGRVAVLVAALAGAAGCLERREEVRIAPDGSVEVAHRFRGNAEEFRAERADALPSGAPWDVRDAESPRDDGKGADRLREASARFASVAEIPETFGAAGDAASLRMRTELAIAREGGVARYAFVRRYEPRAYAWRERAFRCAFPDDLRRELEHLHGSRPPEDLLRRAAAALIAFEREKAKELLEQAIAAAAPDRAGNAAVVLRARAALGRAIDARWSVEDVLRSLDLPPAEKVALEQRFRDETARAATEAAVFALAPEDSSVRWAIEPRVLLEFERARRVLDATEDLQDESFELRVAFPVPVVAADGGSDAAQIEDGGRAVVFRFKGEDLRDVPLVLRALAEGAE